MAVAVVIGVAESPAGSARRRRSVVVRGMHVSAHSHGTASLRAEGCGTAWSRGVARSAIGAVGSRRKFLLSQASENIMLDSFTSVRCHLLRINPQAPRVLDMYQSSTSWWSKFSHRVIAIVGVMTLASSILLVAPGASADPPNSPCQPGPNCYSIAQKTGGNWVGASAAIPRNTTSIGNSSAAFAAHINSEMWMILGNDNYIEIGLRNGYDGVNSATGACNCVAYNQFWAETLGGVQWTHVISHTSPNGANDAYEIVRTPGITNSWLVYLNASQVGSSAAGSWTAVRVDVGGEFQNTSCAPAYGGAVTFDIVAKVRNTSYVWSNPVWSTNYLINTGCGFNGRFDGVAGHWSWNKLNGG